MTTSDNAQSGVRIAVIAEYDPIWCLATWERTLPRLRASGHDLRGLVLCPPKFGSIAPEDFEQWYRETFGARAARRLARYSSVAIRARAFWARLGRRYASFEALAEGSDLRLHYATGPNDRGFQEWLQREGVDILLINVGHIVRRETLSIPRIGTLNLHDSLLPANKGVLPYLRAQITGTPQGITVHDVAPEIDAGAIRAQETVVVSQRCSLIGYQHHVIKRYAQLVSDGIGRLLAGEALDPPAGVEHSYFSLPSADDVAAYRRTGGRVSGWSDIAGAALL